MNPWFDELSVETLRRLDDPGLLLVGAKTDRSCNVMTIGWGFVGILWSMPVFVVAVRPSRYTHEFIDETGEFTVNVPADGMEKVVAYCGEVSGREHDKVAECKFDLVKSKAISPPVIKQCKIHYECRVVHKLEVKFGLIPPDVKGQFYANGDFHSMYFGKILAAY